MQANRDKLSVSSGPRHKGNLQSLTSSFPQASSGPHKDGELAGDLRAPPSLSAERNSVDGTRLIARKNESLKGHGKGKETSSPPGPR